MDTMFNAATANEQLKEIVFTEFNSVVKEFFNGWSEAPEEMAKVFIDMHMLAMSSELFSKEVYEESFYRLQLFFNAFDNIKKKMNE